MSDITRAIVLAVTDRQSAVDVLRGRLAHDWTDVIPPELRDMYERDWAEMFVGRLAEVLAGERGLSLQNLDGTWR